MVLEKVVEGTVFRISPRVLEKENTRFSDYQGDIEHLIDLVSLGYRLLSDRSPKAVWVSDGACKFKGDRPNTCVLRYVGVSDFQARGVRTVDGFAKPPAAVAHLILLEKQENHLQVVELVDIQAWSAAEVPAQIAA